MVIELRATGSCSDDVGEAQLVNEAGGGLGLCDRYCLRTRMSTSIDLFSVVLLFLYGGEAPRPDLNEH